MKSLLTVFTIAFAVVMISETAFAQHRRGGHGRGGHGRGGGHHHGGHHRHRNGTYVTCAPEVVANNLQKADSVLADLAKNELKSNATFVGKISEVAAIASAQDKSAAYLALAGVDSNDAEEVLNFVYAREASASNVLAAQKNLDINADQATLVINKLTEALKLQE